MTYSQNRHPFYTTAIIMFTTSYRGALKSRYFQHHGVNCCKNEYGFLLNNFCQAVIFTNIVIIFRQETHWFPRILHTSHNSVICHTQTVLLTSISSIDSRAMKHMEITSQLFQASYQPTAAITGKHWLVADTLITGPPPCTQVPPFGLIFNLWAIFNLWDMANMV